VAVRACETDPTLRRIVSSDYSASEFDALFFLTGVTTNNFPVAVSTSGCDCL